VTDIAIFPVSAKTGQGFVVRVDWLRNKVWNAMK